MRSFLAKTSGIALDILFPPLCLLCGQSLQGEERAKFLCTLCFARIPLRDALSCGTCGARVPHARSICHQETPYLLAAAASYGDDRVKHLIWQLKYGKRTAAAHALGALVAAYVAPLAREFEDAVLVPIPLHPKRLRERGFNQSELIAKEVARRTGLALRADLLVRVRNTAPQAECSEREERKKNIKNCFALRTGATLGSKRYIVVDDVSTSGATLTEAAAVLKGAGARNTIALVAARA